MSYDCWLQKISHIMLEKSMLRPDTLNKKYQVCKHEYKSIKNICAAAFNIPIVYLACGNASNWQGITKKLLFFLKDQSPTYRLSVINTKKVSARIN